MQPFDLCRVGTVLAVSLVLCASAQAVLQDELEVFDDHSLTPAGSPGLAIHMNATPLGRIHPNFANEIVSHHGLRTMFELSHGIRQDFELGIHIPTAFDEQGRFYTPGIRPRARWIPVRSIDGEGWFLGSNFEISFIDPRFEESRRRFELRPILGYRAREWVFALNPGWTWPLTNATGSRRPLFALDWKYLRSVSDQVRLGLESYGNRGPANSFLPYDQQNRAVFAVAEFVAGDWRWNIGVGHGLTAASDSWTIKAVLELPLEKW